MPRNLKRSEGIQLFDLDRNNNVWELIKTLVNGGTDESRLLELYYWSQEPGVVELIRIYLEMSERSRRALGDFLLNARPQSIVANADMPGSLLLSQSDAVAARSEKRRQSTDV